MRLKYGAFLATVVAVAISDTAFFLAHFGCLLFLGPTSRPSWDGLMIEPAQVLVQDAVMHDGTDCTADRHYAHKHNTYMYTHDMLM